MDQQQTAAEDLAAGLNARAQGHHQPTVVQARKQRQAGFEILVAPCPHCGQVRAVNGPGKLACPCGAALQFEEAAP